MKDENISIYIYRDGGLGDSLTILPALKKLYEGTGGKKKFTLITNGSAQKFNKIDSYSVLKYSDLFENVLYFDDAGLSSKTKLLKTLRKIKNDKILYYFGYTDVPLPRALKKTLLHLSFFKLCGFKRVIGWKEAIIDNKKNKSADTVESEYYRYLRIADMAGNNNEAGNFYESNSVFLNLDYAKPDIYKLIENFNIKGDYISIGIGGLYEVNRYFNKRYAAVIEMISDKFTNMGFVLIGGEKDYDEGEKIKSALRGELSKNVINICGKSSVIESAYIIGNGVIYIGNDTGTTHLAAMTGCPILAIFSARERKEKYFPYGKNNITIRKDIECENCGLKVCAEKNTKCVDIISVKEVFDSAVKLIYNKKFK
jgi:ADP-heptose:LPS heptosyltransferase